MHKTTEELETQNVTWVSNHPDSVLAALFSMWKNLKRQPETICMLTVAAFLNLEDYDTYEWKELDRDQAFDSLFERGIPFVVVEFHTKGDREEGCDPQHTLLFWRDEESRVRKVESWWLKKRPLMTLVDRSSMESMEISAPELSDCMVYYLTFLGRR